MHGFVEYKVSHVLEDHPPISPDENYYIEWIYYVFLNFKKALAIITILTLIPTLMIEMFSLLYHCCFPPCGLIPLKVKMVYHVSY